MFTQDFAASNICRTPAFSLFPSQWGHQTEPSVVHRIVLQNEEPGRRTPPRVQQTWSGAPGDETSLAPHMHPQLLSYSLSLSLCLCILRWHAVACWQRYEAGEWSDKAVRRPTQPRIHECSPLVLAIKGLSPREIVVHDPRANGTAPTENVWKLFHGLLHLIQND